MVKRRKLNKMVCSLLFLMFVFMIGVMPAEKVNAEKKTVEYYSIGTCEGTWGTEINNKLNYIEGEVFDCTQYTIPGQRYTAHYTDGTSKDFRIHRLTGPELYVKYTEPMTRNSEGFELHTDFMFSEDGVWYYRNGYITKMNFYWKDPMGVEHLVGSDLVCVLPKENENVRPYITGEESTETPTETPTEAPTVKPTEAPTKVPVVTPTVTPTEKPTTPTNVEKPTESAKPVEKETPASTEAETMVSTENTPVETPSESATAEVEVETSVEGIHTVKGQLKYKDGTPLADTYIELHSVVKKGRTDANGYYEFTGVESGDHKLTAFNENGDVIGEFSLTVGNDTTAMVVENAFTVEADAPVKNNNMTWTWVVVIIVVVISSVAGIAIYTRKNKEA